MSKHAHLSFGLIAPVTAMLLLTLSGCGDDDDGAKDAGAGKGGGGGETAGSSSAGKGGSSAGASGGKAGAGGAATGSGSLLEGDQCTTTPECGTGLTCVTGAVGQTAVRICARSCAQDTDCGKSDAGGKGTETCESPYTNLARDAHCINLQPDPFGYCGVGETAACDGDRACLYFPNLTIGICVDLCATDPSLDSGIADLPAMCPGTTNKCVSGVVENDAVGVCGTQVARDAACGIEMGIFCSGTDICVPDDVTADEGPQHCREDCTDTNMCTGGGACTAVRNLFRYCKK